MSSVLIRTAATNSASPVLNVFFLCVELQVFTQYFPARMSLPLVEMAVLLHPAQTESLKPSMKHKMRHEPRLLKQVPRQPFDLLPVSHSRARHGTTDFPTENYMSGLSKAKKLALAATCLYLLPAFTSRRFSFSYRSHCFKSSPGLVMPRSLASASPIAWMINSPCL